MLGIKILIKNNHIREAYQISVEEKLFEIALKIVNEYLPESKSPL